MAATVIYVDVNSGTCYDESGAQIVNDNRLESFIDSHETYEIHYVTDGGAAGLPENWTPYTGFQGSSVASAFGVDNNFVHQYESELQGEGINKGDAVTELTVSLAIEEMLIPKAGLLVLRNAAGEEQTFEYSARTGGNGAYTFSIISTEAKYDFAAGSIVAVPEALMVLAEGTENPENYVDDSRKDNGIFTAHWWNMSDKIMSYFDFESIEEMDAIIEHAITVNGETVKRIQQSITLRKPLIFHRPASVPSVNNQRIASQTWVLSILRETMEYQFSVDGENDWHAAQTEDDRFYRERPENLAGEWGSAIRMVQGTAGKIVSVSAVTLEPGSSPTVENTGTGTEAKLKFGFAPGPAGPAAGFGTPTATIEGLETGATPEITVSASGSSTEKVFAFAFKIPAGPVGATPQFAIGSVTSGDTPSATITGTAKNPVLNLVLQRGEVGFLDTAETLDASGPGYEAGSVVTWGNPVETYQVVTAITSGETPETAPEKFHKLAGAGGNGYTFTPSVSASGDLSWTNNGNLNNPSAVNIKGPTGATFFPSVSADGLLSWSNDGGKANPASVNIRGPVGYCFIPAVSAEGVLSFTNNGNLENPAPVRVKGTTFTPSISEDGIISFTNDGGLENPAPVSVKGPAGTGINPKGVWNENTTYAIHDMVRGNSATWISKSDGNAGNALPVLPEEENEWWYLNQKDGSVISSVEKTGSAGLTDTYTITTSTNATFTFTVTNGKGISTIAKTSTNGNVDTYTITFNDGTSMTFTVTNGTNGTDGAAATIQITDTETLTAGNNASFEELSGSTAQARKYKARIPSGNGISSITKTGTNGNVDTYTVAFTNGTSTTFTVTNGLNGEDGTAATIQIGSVTQGDTPSVANSGTPGAAVLDFVLPKGSTGSQGAAAISFAVLTAVTDEATFAGTAQLVNPDGTAGETVNIVYDFAVPASGE